VLIGVQSIKLAADNSNWQCCSQAKALAGIASAALSKRLPLNFDNENDKTACMLDVLTDTTGLRCFELKQHDSNTNVHDSADPTLA
jgi:hypothetical protein